MISAGRDTSGIHPRADWLARARLMRARVEREPQWIPVHGHSMGPAFPIGAELLIRACRRRPRVGEVWLFAADTDQMVAHRYLGRSDNGFIFRGDALGYMDPPVDSTMLIGRAHKFRIGPDERSVPRRGLPRALVWALKLLWTRGFNRFRRETVHNE